MLIGYMRVSETDAPQTTDPQRSALLAAGVPANHCYADLIPGRQDERPGLAACLKALRRGDTLVVWRLDRLGRDLRHLIGVVHELIVRGVGLKVLSGHGAVIDTTAALGSLVSGVFAALVEFERELFSERTAAVRARVRKGGRPLKMTAAKLRQAMAAMREPKTKVSELCKELGITRQTLYRHVSPSGELRPDGARLLEQTG